MVSTMAAPPVTAPEAPEYRTRMVPVALALLAVAAATLTGALVTTRIYAGIQLPVLLAGATLGSVAFTLLLRMLRAGPVTAVVGGLVGLVACLVGATAALRDPAAGSLVAALLDAARNSGARILTSAIPVPPAPDTVLLPIAATWLCGSVSTVLLGPPRAGQTAAGGNRRAALAGVPPVLLLIGGLVLVGPNGSPSYPVLGGFVLALAVLLAASGQPWSVRAADPVGGEAGRALRIARTRRAVAALLVVGLLGATSVVAGPALSHLTQRQPVDPRSYVVPPTTQQDQLNPLGMLAAWALDPHQHLLTVRTNHPERIQWATLSGYDGISWQPDRTYRAAGSVLPPPPATTDPTRTVRQTVTVGTLGGGWLPAVSRVTKVRGVRVGFDAESGTVLTPEGLSRGLTYSTVSSAPQPDPTTLSGASVVSGPAAARYLEVPPGIDYQVATLARKTAGTGTPYRRALMLEHLLRTKYKYWSKAPSGNGYVTLKNFLLSDPKKGGGRGTSEQFATAFALLARVVGLPTRVVVGFHAGHKLSNGSYRITSGDAFAWPEVKFAGHGWVPFDPTPTAAKGDTPPDENTPQAKSQQKQKNEQLDDSQPTANPSIPTPTPSKSGRADGKSGGAVSPAVVGGASGGLLVVLLLLVIPLLRWRRTVRHLDSGPPAMRVLGAWAEVRDTLRLAGARADPALSAAELAEYAAAAPGRRQEPGLTDLRPLAAAVNAVGFAADARLGDGDGASAAGAARHYARGVRARLGWVRRLVWRLDPRPLFWK